MSINGVRDRSRTVRHRRWPVLFAAVGALVLTGCGGAAQESTAPALSQEAREAAPESAARDGFGQTDSARSADGSAGGENKDAGTRVNVQPEGRAIVYTAEMTVRATDVAAAAEKAKQLVTAAGGYVADERSDSAANGEGRAMLTLKVPPDRYPEVLGRLGRDLGERESLHQATEDVTEEVADVAARVKSAEATVAQFRTLLTKAEKIGEILEIEREISQRTAELEALQARQKALAARTGMATINLSLIGPAAAPPDDDEPAGFFGGLVTGWESLVAAARVALTVFGVLLPWLAVATVFALAIRLGMRTVRRRPRPARDTAPASPPAPPVQSEQDAPSTPGPAGTAPTPPASPH